MGTGASVDSRGEAVALRDSIFDSFSYPDPEMVSAKLVESLECALAFVNQQRKSANDSDVLPIGTSTADANAVYSICILEELGLNVIHNCILYHRQDAACALLLNAIRRFVGDSQHGDANPPESAICDISCQENVRLQTVLHQCAIRGFHKSSKIILELSGDRLLLTQDVNRDTALHLALKHRNHGVAMNLIEHLSTLEASDVKQMLEAQNIDGDRVLHVACRIGDLKVVEALVEMGADVNAHGEFRCQTTFKNSRQHALGVHHIDSQRGDAINTLDENDKNESEEFAYSPYANCPLECLIIGCGAVLGSSRNSTQEQIIDDKEIPIKCRSSRSTFIECMRVLVRAGANVRTLTRERRGLIELAVSCIGSKIYDEDKLQAVSVKQTEDEVANVKESESENEDKLNFSWNLRPAKEKEETVTRCSKTFFSRYDALFQIMSILKEQSIETGENAVTGGASLPVINLIDRTRVNLEARRSFEGSSILSIACADNNFALVRAILQTDFEKVNGAGMVPPLVVAAACKHYDIAKLLLKLGASPTKTAVETRSRGTWIGSAPGLQKRRLRKGIVSGWVVIDSMNAIDVAAANGDIAMLELLLRHAATEAEDTIDLSMPLLHCCTSNEGENSELTLKILQLLIDPMKTWGITEKLNRYLFECDFRSSHGLLKFTRDGKPFVGDDSINIMQGLCANRHFRSIEYIVGACAQMTHKKIDKFPNSIDGLRGITGFCESLSSAFSVYNTRYSKQVAKAFKFFGSPLLFLMKKGAPEGLLNSFIQTFSLDVLGLDITDETSKNAHMWAVIRGFGATLRLLTEGFHNGNGAKASGDAIVRARENLFAHDFRGLSALHTAVKNYNDNILVELHRHLESQNSLEACANLLKFESQGGKTIIQAGACSKSGPAFLIFVKNLLLKFAENDEIAGALFVDLVEQTNKVGDSVIVSAARSGHFNTVQWIFENIYEGGNTAYIGNGQWCSRQGQTLVHFAAMHDRSDVVELVVKIFVEQMGGKQSLCEVLDCRDNAGYTPLMYARGLGNARVISSINDLFNANNIDDIANEAYKVQTLHQVIYKTTERPSPSLANALYCGLQFSMDFDDEDDDGNPCLTGEILSCQWSPEDNATLFEMLCPNYETKEIESKNYCKKDMLTILENHFYFTYDFYSHYYECENEKADRNSTSLPQFDPVSGQQNNECMHAAMTNALDVENKGKVWIVRSQKGFNPDIDAIGVGWLKYLSSTTVEGQNKSNTAGESEIECPSSFLSKLPDFSYKNVIKITFPNTRIVFVEMLLSLGHNPNERDNSDGWTALMHAADAGYENVVAILLKGGADPTIACAISPTSSAIFLPQECAQARGHNRCALAIKEFCQTYKPVIISAPEAITGQQHESTVTKEDEVLQPVAPACLSAAALNEQSHQSAGKKLMMGEFAHMRSSFGSVQQGIPSAPPRPFVPRGTPRGMAPRPTMFSSNGVAPRPMMMQQKPFQQPEASILAGGRGSHIPARPSRPHPRPMMGNLQGMAPRPMICTPRGMAPRPMMGTPQAMAPRSTTVSSPSNGIFPTAPSPRPMMMQQKHFQQSGAPTLAGSRGSHIPARPSRPPPRPTAPRPMK